MPRIWDDVIPEHDRAIYRAAGFGKRMALGDRPVALVIDVTYEFTGDRPEPVLDSIRRFPYSCGSAAWDSMAHIGRLLASCRQAGVPVFYTRGPVRKTALTLGGWTRTQHRYDSLSDPGAGPGSGPGGTPSSAAPPDPGDLFPPLVAPKPGDVVVEKLKSSAFFGTPLMALLMELRADTLLVCGVATSGCVRATVFDAFAYGFRVAVVEEATFDRSPFSHQVSLFEMDQKYANVIPTAAAVAYVQGWRRTEPHPHP